MSLIVDALQVEPGPVRFKGVVGRPLMNADLGAVSVAMSLLTIEPGGTLPLHTHEYEEAFYVVEGTGVVAANGVEHAIRPGLALLASTGDIHGFSNRSDAPLRILCMFGVGRPVGKFVEPGA